MATYAIFFSFTSDSLSKFVQSPSDRATAVSALLERGGGTLRAYYWMLGEHDGMVIYDVPDSQTAAAVSIAVASSGAFRALKTHELFPSDAINGLVDRARGMAANYSAPGT